MKIASTSNKHKVLIKPIVFLFIVIAACPVFSFGFNCEDDFEKPTIKFPDLSNVVSGDTMYFACAENILGIAQARALVFDNCDPDPLVEFGEFCLETGDCSKGYRYLVECKWTVVDSNNNVTEFIIYIAIVDETPPTILLNWGDDVMSGDTLFMECGYAEPFDESYVTVMDDCNLSVFCDIQSPIRDLVFEELVVGQGNCDDYLTEMSCSWTAIDRCGNTSVFTLVIFVTDNNPPEFGNIPESYCGSESISEEQFQEYRKGLSDIEVNDICTEVEVKYTIGGRSDGCSYRIQWEASDACGNTSYYEQLVCINDVRCAGQVSGTVKVDNNKDRVGDDPISEVTLYLVEDVNRNGKVDGGEIVYLTTTTDVNGFYRFTDVPQGCYVIVELQPNGLADVSDEDVTNPGNVDKDGTNDPIDNLIPVCIEANEYDDGNDFVEEQFVLEVILSRFSAFHNQDQNTVTINWETEHELNSDFFVVERSISGQDFTAVAQIDSKSKNGVGSVYTHLDKTLPHASTLYYRLKDVDNDGIEQYSGIVSVSLDNSNNELLVYPNPTSDVFNIFLVNDYPDGTSVLELFDLSGKLVHIENYEANSIQLDMGLLEHGAYFLRVTTVNGSVIKRLIYTN